MKKVPTLFLRDEQDRSRVTREVNPACAWVLAGEGVATRKYDGTCARLTNDGLWWARREVKPGKVAPHGYVPVELDENTGKTVGWEPIEQSAFAKFHADALKYDADFSLDLLGYAPGTYELIGPKVNGNPEGWSHHALIEHAHAQGLPNAPRTWDELYIYLGNFAGEGIVWHHPDGRMAKLKRRDFGYARDDR